MKTSKLRWPWLLERLDDLRRLRRLKPYSVSIGLLTRSHRWPAALRLFEELRRQRISTGAGTVAAALMACRQASRWEDALRFEAFRLSSVGRNGLVSALVRGYHVEMALKRADSVGSYNSMLMSLVHTSLTWTWALHILEKMRESGVKPNLGSFKAAASALKARPSLVLPVYELLCRSNGLQELDTTSLNMLLSSLERCHRWEQALYFLATSRSDLRSYNSAISACGKAARWPLAIHLASEAQGWDAITLGSLLSACTNGAWILALELLEQARCRGILSRIAYHSAILACGQHWLLAIQLLSESISQRIAPDVTLLGAVMSSLERGQRWTQALQLLRDAPEVDAVLLNSCVSAVAKAHRWETTLQLLREAGTLRFPFAC